MCDDQLEIDALVREFFSVFSPGANGTVNLSPLRRMFVARAVIVKSVAARAEVMSLEEFIAPRERLLNDGTLTDFREREQTAKTEVFGNIAQRFATYCKSGRLHGVAFTTRGMKTMQFVRDGGAWKISALAWDDEREGLSVPDEREQSSAVGQRCVRSSDESGGGCPQR